MRDLPVRQASSRFPFGATGAGVRQVCRTLPGRRNPLESSSAEMLEQVAAKAPSCLNWARSELRVGEVVMCMNDGTK